MSPRRSRSGGHADPDHLEPAQQVVAEPTLAHVELQRAGRGGEDPHIDPPGVALALALHHAAVQQLEETALGRGSTRADTCLSSSVPLCASSARPIAAVPCGAGTLAAEQLGLEDRGRDRGAIHHDEGTLRAAAARVDRLGHQLLARRPPRPR